MLTYIYNSIQKFIPFEYIYPYKLAIAINTSDVKQVEKCLDQNYNVNKKFNSMLNCTYMHEATYLITNGVTILRLLLDAGADLESQDLEGRTPLFYAVMHGNCEIIEFLVNRGANIHHKDNEGQTLLFYAIINREHEIAKCLLKLGAFDSNDNLLRMLAQEAQTYLSLLKNQHTDHQKIIQRLINLDDISNWLIAYGAKIKSDPLITSFISTHQLKMTFFDCTDNQIIKFTSIANILFESWQAFKTHPINLNLNFMENVANIICIIDLICTNTNHLNLLYNKFCNNRFTYQAFKNLIENEVTNNPPTLDIKRLSLFIDKELQGAKSPKQAYYTLNEIKQMILSLKKLNHLDLTLQESLKRFTEIDTKPMLKKAKDMLGDKKAHYLANQGKKAALIGLKYELPDNALANVAGFAPHFYAIATASKNALPQICSKILEDELDDYSHPSESYIIKTINKITLYIIGEDMLVDTYDI